MNQPYESSRSTTGNPACVLLPKKDDTGEFTEVHALFTVLNYRDSEKRSWGMIVFSRITSTGTQGAAEFFSSPKSVAELRGKLDGKMPTAYQVVVRCTYSNKLLPDYHYHSHKIL